MKRIIVCVGLLVSLAVSTSAQSNGKAGSKKQQVTNKKNTLKNSTTKKSNTNTSGKVEERQVTLISTSQYNAFSTKKATQQHLTISDPVIRTLNERANTPSNLDVSGSRILGMPRLTYGIANGQIIFRTTDAPTIGTSTGSGSVGTGTNVGAIGTAGNALGVNGKNPYAGPGIYGLPLTDEIGTKATNEGARPIGVRRKE